MNGKLLNNIKSIFVNSRVKRCESECFRIGSGVKQVGIMFSWLFNVYMDAVMMEVKIGMGRKGVRFEEEGKEWRLSGLLYANDLVLCCELEEELGVIVGRFIEVCRRRGLKGNAGKSKMMLLGGEEGLECEVCVNGIRLEYFSEFKYLECVLDESVTDEAKCSGRRFACAIRYLVNDRSLQLECVRVLHEGKAAGWSSKGCG